MKGPVDLPRATITKLMKNAAEAPMSVSSGANAVMSEAARVFVHYLSSRADELAKGKRRNIVTPDFVLDAVKDLEFDFMSPTLEALMDHEQRKRDQKNNERKLSDLKERLAAVQQGAAVEAIDPSSKKQKPKMTQLTEQQLKEEIQRLEKELGLMEEGGEKDVVAVVAATNIGQ